MITKLSLHLAAAYGHAGCVRYLINKKHKEKLPNETDFFTYIWLHDLDI
ncbi:hypothetical protein [Candidatus Cardinium hertigii]